MEGKSLELVIAESRSSDTILALDKYFKTSSESPKSVLTEDAINILFNKVKQCPEFLPYVVKCFDDFISNQQMQQEWLYYYNELTQLCRACLDDAISLSAHRMDICRIFRSLGRRGEPLSSTLFNTCAGKFLEFIDSSFIDMEIIDSLSVLTILCKNSEHSCIDKTIELQAYQIYKLAARSFTLSIDAQISVYWFLMGVIFSKEDAHGKACVWYPHWPNIQRIFFDYHPNNMSEGCGVFLLELGHQLGLPEEESTPSSTPERSQLQPNSHCNISSIPDKERGSSSDISENLFWDEPWSPPEVPRHSIIADSPIFKSSRLVFSTPCTTASAFDTPSDATVNLSKTSEKSASLKASSFSLHCPPLEIGDDFSIPLVPLKNARNVFLDKNGKWCYKIKNHPNTQRWPSFKWANSEKNRKRSLGKGKSN